MKSVQGFCRRLLSVSGQLVAIALVSLSVLLAAPTWAGSLEQAKRLYERLTGVVPAGDSAVLASMRELIEAQNPEAAAALAMEQNAFYDVTLVHWAAPWTNRDQSVFVPFNDYIATVVGLVRDDRDFRELLYDDVLYIGRAVSPAYGVNHNQHYEAIKQQALPLKTTLERALQSQVTGLPVAATAGILTSRAAAKSFFIAGTNRAMLRFTLLNHLCHDLEQLHDTSLPPDRIRQDVSRSPGGDSRAFLNGCMGCHNGMDPLAQAFAYYNFDYDADQDPSAEQGRLVYLREGEQDPVTGSRVHAKYRINSATFLPGFITPDDQWQNYWRQGINATLGWDNSLPGLGQGAKSLGQELAHSHAFSQCQATKVFRQICLRSPETPEDAQAVTQMVSRFASGGHRVKTLYASAAVYCMGDSQ